MILGGNRTLENFRIFLRPQDLERTREAVVETLEVGKNGWSNGGDVSYVWQYLKHQGNQKKESQYETVVRKINWKQ